MGTPGSPQTVTLHHEVPPAARCHWPGLLLPPVMSAEAAAGLVARLTTDASIEEQAGILIATVCPQAPDAAACEAGITKYWGEIANCLFPEFLGGDDVCVKLGYCTKTTTILGDWTCEECTAALAKVAGFIKDPDTVAKGIAFLQGD